MRDDTGVTLTELVVVLALLGVVLTAVFTTVQVLSDSAAATTQNSTGTNDMSYTMELLSKAIMGGRLLYASDQRIVFLTTTDDGGREVQSVYATASVDPSATAGQLVWERWSCDESATAPVAGTYRVWVMSENNANLAPGAAVPLFAFYKDATDSSLMSELPPDKASAPDASVSAFLGTLPGGYNIQAIGRVRLRVAARFKEGVRDNFRDIVLRVRG
jgi:prepilin-type N-terminal cleavage/methylation domain-containing protein